MFLMISIVIPQKYLKEEFPIGIINSINIIKSPL